MLKYVNFVNFAKFSQITLKKCVNISNTVCLKFEKMLKHRVEHLWHLKCLTIKKEQTAYSADLEGDKIESLMDFAWLVAWRGHIISTTGGHVISISVT